MARIRLTDEQREKLVAFVKEQRAKDAGISVKALLNFAQTAPQFQGIVLTISHINKALKLNGKTGKRGGHRKPDPVPASAGGGVDEVEAVEAPCLAGLLRKLKELVIYVEQIQGEQKKKLEKLFL